MFILQRADESKILSVNIKDIDFELNQLNLFDNTFFVVLNEDKVGSFFQCAKSSDDKYIIEVKINKKLYQYSKVLDYEKTLYWADMFLKSDICIDRNWLQQIF
ncbi:MAG: hypothetical protein COB02_10630 [Candidatus Cloacimonadota bacterium]|nr:MAG: hypothetical protein COB02_10630 [Candidatus Cloacimonadota bacterium]